MMQVRTVVTSEERGEVAGGGGGGGESGRGWRALFSVLTWSVVTKVRT